MNIFIMTMDDPILTNNFFGKVLSYYREDISGICVCKGGRLDVYKQSRLEYIFVLFFVLGIVKFAENSIKSILFKVDKFFCRIIGKKSKLSILHISELLEIPSYEFDDANDPELLKILKSNKPDLIINQTQSLLKKDLLDIPRIGTINRHNALLPKHKGRIAPFWAILAGDSMTGVSIHFVNEKIDDGPIIYQFSYKIKSYSFNKIVSINYKIAPLAMLKAIDNLEKNVNISTESDKKGNYNSTPRFTDLAKYLSKIYN